MQTSFVNSYIHIKKTELCFKTIYNSRLKERLWKLFISVARDIMADYDHDYNKVTVIVT